MYCPNCGNKVNDNAYICVNCGVILDNHQMEIKKKKKNNSLVLGILSIIFGIISLVFSFSLFFINISDVGMYNKLIERVSYAFGFVLIPVVFMIISLIFALIQGKKTKLNYVGLFISLTSLFLIITEVMVVIIY